MVHSSYVKSKWGFRISLIVYNARVLSTVGSGGGGGGGGGGEGGSFPPPLKRPKNFHCNYIIILLYMSINTPGHDMAITHIHEVMMPVD